MPQEGGQESFILHRDHGVQEPLPSLRDRQVRVRAGAEERLGEGYPLRISRCPELVQGRKDKKLERCDRSSRAEARAERSDVVLLSQQVVGGADLAAKHRFVQRVWGGTWMLPRERDKELGH